MKWQITDDEATIAKVMNVELEVMMLETQEIGSDEMSNLRHYEQYKGLKTNM